MEMHSTATDRVFKSSKQGLGTTDIGLEGLTFTFPTVILLVSLSIKPAYPTGRRKNFVTKV